MTETGFIKLPMGKHNGFSLVEIMIALFLSSLLIAGILQIFLSNKQTYNTASELSQLQENARFAMIFISKAIRGADNWGCMEDRSKVIGTSYPNGVTGTDGASDNAPDTLTVAGAYGVPEPVILASGNDIGVNDATGFKTDQDILINNCQYAEITTVNKQVSATQLQTKTALNRTYSTDASIQGIQTATYSISYLTDSGDLCTTQAWSSTCTPNLMLDDDGDGKNLVPLISGVENIQFKFGEDTDGDQVANYYVDADEVVNMNRVISVKVSILMATQEEVASKPGSYVFLYNKQGTSDSEQTITASDNRIRRVFNATYALRNRIL